MRISRISSATPVMRSMGPSGLSARATEKLNGTRKLISPQTIIQDVQDIKEILSLPKIDPVPTLKPVGRPFDYDNEEQGKNEQKRDAAAFIQESMAFAMAMGRQNLPQKQTDTNTKNEALAFMPDNTYNPMVTKAIAAYSAYAAMDAPRDGLLINSAI